MQTQISFKECAGDMETHQNEQLCGAASNRTSFHCPHEANAACVQIILTMQA